MTSPSRRLAAVLLTATLAAGCGQATSSGTSGPPRATTHAQIDPELLANAASATTRAGSARLTMQMQMSGPQGAFNAHAHGVMNFSKPRQAEIDMVMNVPNMATPISMTERMVGTTIYMRMPFLNAADPKIKPWVKLDLAAMGKAAGLNLGALINSSTNDPASMMAYLRGASGKVQNLGQETVGGVNTTHYRATVEYSKMVAEMKNTDPAAASALQQAMDKTGMRSEPVDVWVDGSGLMRQERLDVQIPSTSSRMTMVMDLSDFGVPVHVSAPPASQTTDLLKLLRSQSAGGTA
jgi:hypothetical protein